MHSICGRCQANFLRVSNQHARNPAFCYGACPLRKGNNLASLAFYFLLCKQRDKALSGCFQFCEAERSKSSDIVKGLFFCLVKH